MANQRDIAVLFSHCGGIQYKIPNDLGEYAFGAFSQGRTADIMFKCVVHCHFTSFISYHSDCATVFRESTFVDQASG